MRRLYQAGANGDTPADTHSCDRGIIPGTVLDGQFNWLTQCMGLVPLSQLVESSTSAACLCLCPTPNFHTCKNPYRKPVPIIHSSLTNSSNPPVMYPSRGQVRSVQVRAPLSRRTTIPDWARMGLLMYAHRPQSTVNPTPSGKRVACTSWIEEIWRVYRNYKDN